MCVLLGVNSWIDRPAPMPELPEAVQVPTMEPDEVWLGVQVKVGSTFGVLMAGRGLSSSELREAGLEYYDLAKIRPDRDLQIGYKDGVTEPVAVRYQIDSDTLLVVRRTAEGWKAEVEEVSYTSRIGTHSLSIERSLWQDGLAAGLSEWDSRASVRDF